jgi:phospholipid N-methyltransferase
MANKFFLKKDIMNKKIFILLFLSSLLIIGLQNFSKNNKISYSSSSSQFLHDLKIYWKDNTELWKALWNNRTEVSALTVSSPWLVREIIKPFTECKKNKIQGLNILEIGFGPAPITRKLVEQMADNDALYAIELIESMYTTAKKNLPEKNNVHLVNSDFTTWMPTGVTDINNVPNDQQYDYIITTLPFTQLPSDTIEPILSKITALLKPHGTFTYISLIGAELASNLITWGDENKKYRNKMNIFSDWKLKNFYNLDQKPSNSRREWIFFNITPAWVTHLVKK